jgi:hypothetical protein
MKGKLKSYLSCIPDLTCFDLKADSDDFLLISTDGIFSAMDIGDIVRIPYYIDNIYKREIWQALDVIKPGQNIKWNNLELQSAKQPMWQHGCYTDLYSQRIAQSLIFFQFKKDFFIVINNENKLCASILH